MRSQKDFEHISVRKMPANNSLNTDGKKRRFDEIKRRDIACDSTSFIHDKILELTKSKLIDINLTNQNQGIENLNEIISGALDEYNRSDRMFVYFA